MSLFKTRTFWKIHSEIEDSFDQNSLLVTKISDNDVIVTGSHSGILRIFQPSCEINDNHLVDYKATDLLIEVVLNDPILQIATGKLVSGSSKIHLAILQSRILGVYSLLTKEGATEHGVQHQLQLCYEHKLKRLAYNVTIGQFGGSLNRDFICIQSLDGLVTFYEQESFAFCCFLPDFLLPGPLVFNKKTDSFITSNCNWQIISFKYKLLSEAGLNSIEDDNVGKKVSPDWKYNLGEPIIDLELVLDSISKEIFIMILGEKNLFCLNEFGKMKYMKRLEFAPICFTTYYLNDRIVSLVVSETKNVLVYQNTSLKWCAQLETQPVAIKRAFFQKISGVLVFLSEFGLLQCSYLGTEPSLFVAPPLTMQELDFEKTGEELARLYHTIKNSYSNDIKVTNASAERELSFSITMGEVQERKVSISIEMQSQGLFEEVQIVPTVYYPLQITPAIAFLSNLNGKSRAGFVVSVMEVVEVASLNVEVVVSFISSLGVPRSVTRCAMLPLNLVLETCLPLKDSDCKVTLSINQSPVGLAGLFPEFSFSTNGNAIGFKTADGVISSILLAKSSERYRLQSNSFASLSLLIEQLVYRLKNYYSNNNDFAISFNPPVPITEALISIRRHFNTNHRYTILQTQLTQLTSQFRLIQKRLLSKFKVKNPTPLSNLELILSDTFNEIMQTANDLQEEHSNLIKTQNELRCTMNVLRNLINLMECNNNVQELIDSIFSPAIYDLEGQSFDDVFDASLCFLLRTVLAKSEKDKLRAAHTSFDEIKDVAKIEKHLAQAVERIPKGVLLESHCGLEGGVFELKTLFANYAFIEKQEEDDNDVQVPIGSKIGEASSRLLSARKGLLSRRQKGLEG